MVAHAGAQALAANVASQIERRYPGITTLTRGRRDGRGMPVLEVRPAAGQAADVAAFLAPRLPAPRVATLGRLEYAANGFIVDLTCFVPVSTGMRILASVLLDLDTRTGGELAGMLAGTTSVPAELREPAGRDDSDRDGVYNLLFSRVDAAQRQFGFAAAVPLDPPGEVLARLLTDKAVEVGLNDYRPYSRAAGETVIARVIDMSDDGHYIVGIARGLADDRPPVRIAAAAVPALTPRGRA